MELHGRLRERLTRLNAPQSDQSQPVSIQRVQESIRGARHASSQPTFIPNNELNRILTHSTISDLVRSLTNYSADDTDPELATLVNEIDPSPHETQYKSRKRIFAILIMIGIPSSIIHFVDAGIYDKHLPFEAPEHVNNRQLEYSKDDGSRVACPYRCFDNNPDKLDMFEFLQWEFVAPFFEFKEGKIHHYEFQQRTRLPFIEKKFVSATGHSQISRVVIHDGHHDLIDIQCFALKRLLDSTDENFKREVKALRYVRNFNHPHLIELLGTFKYQDCFYLIFQWADDDLRTFWKNNPSPSNVASTSRWALQQCLGIAQGLQMIHSGQSSSSETPLLMGRHGDIKPENILRFAPRRAAGIHDRGILKVSDFGLTRFHQQHSCRREYKNGLQATLTYRAPEGDLQREISFSWDLWPLGCLYLEFLTWLLQGWQGLVKFSDERDSEELLGPNGYGENKFFLLNRAKAYGACRKESVSRHIHSLYHHPDCNGLIHDFLDFISKDLLRIRDDHRATCNEVVQRLEAMERNCNEDDTYYIKRQKRFMEGYTFESDKFYKPPIEPFNVDDINCETEQNHANDSMTEGEIKSDSGGDEILPYKSHKIKQHERRAIRRFLNSLTSCFRARDGN